MVSAGTSLQWWLHRLACYGKIPVCLVTSSHCHSAFIAVKSLCCSTALAAPNFEKTFKIQVDPSGIGPGAIVLLEDQ